MNCLDFRREILVNPRAASEETLRHALDCVACADFQARATALDAEIAELLDVPVPEGLEERVLEATSAGRRDSRRRFLAMAASLAGVAVVGTGVLVARATTPWHWPESISSSRRRRMRSSREGPDPAELVRAVRTLGLDLPPSREVRTSAPAPSREPSRTCHRTTPQGKATLLLLRTSRSTPGRGVVSRTAPIISRRDEEARPSSPSLPGTERIEQMVGCHELSPRSARNAGI